MKGLGGAAKGPGGNGIDPAPYKNPSAICLRRAPKINSFDAPTKCVQKYLILYTHSLCIWVPNGEAIEMVKARRAVLYVRVSTDHQSVENQVRELREVAEHRGWSVVEVYRDAGISGAKG